MPEPNTPGATSGVTYGLLNQKHPERDCDYLCRLRAFYEGGQKLLGNGALMARVFPRHRREVEEVYSERISRAFYIGICGEIVDYLTATLMSDPIRLGTAEGSTKNETTAPSEWYSGWFRNVAPKGSPVMPLGEFLRGSAQGLMVSRESWVRVDLPQASDYPSVAEQDKAGGRDAWLVQIPTDCVWDWKEDAAGALEWVVVHSTERPRNAITDQRTVTVERWMVYDREKCTRYRLAYKDENPPKDSDVVPLDGDDVPHRFGMVPIVRKTVPDGLWAMDTLESIQREHFNKRNSLAWGEFQSLLPELYEFCAPEAPAKGAVIGQNQKDPERAVSQPRGQGYVQRRGNEDDARFVGPPVDPFVEARKSCQELRDEMHRVMHLMALSVSNTSSMLGRSAASKAQDQAATGVVCGELGRHLREHAVAIMEMVSRARGEVGLKDQWKATGATQFTITSTDEVVDRGTKVETLTIKSPTFHKKHQAAMAETILGDAATPDVMEAIEGELEKNITAEDMQPIVPRVPVNLGKPGGEGDGTENEDGTEDGGNEPPKPPANGQKKPAKKKKATPAKGKPANV